MPLSRMPLTNALTLYAFVVSLPQERRLSSMNEFAPRWSLDGSRTGARFMLILMSFSVRPIFFESIWIFVESMWRISRALGVLFHWSEYDVNRLTRPPSWSSAVKRGILRLRSISSNRSL